MGRRYVQDDLYDKPWFRKLRSEVREAFWIIWSKVDSLGLWTMDFETLNQWLGTSEDPVTLDELKESFKGRLNFVVSGDELFIAEFVPLQCGDAGGKLSQESQYHTSLANKIEAKGLPVPAFNPPNQNPKRKKSSGIKPSDTPPPSPPGGSTPTTPFQLEGEGTSPREEKRKEESRRDEKREGGPGETTDLASWCSEAEVYLLAARHRAQHGPTFDVRSWLGEERWLNVVEMGGWEFVKGLEGNKFGVFRIAKLLKSFAAQKAGA